MIKLNTTYYYFIFIIFYFKFNSEYFKKIQSGYKIIDYVILLDFISKF